MPLTEEIHDNATRFKSGYARQKGRALQRELDQSAKGRDIADDYPPDGNPERRASCSRSFRLFCETYFPAAFVLAWSDDHLRAIDRIESAILHGGLFALAMPRGSGKTTLCEKAVIWALVYRHRRFVCLIGPTEGAAETNLEHIKTELSYNDLLHDDFRNVCYPIRRIENNARRCNGQLFDGEQTRITWSSRRLTLPTMAEHLCSGPNVSGSTVTVAGLTGALRGQSHALPTGETVRPELVMLDDPQTHESANSPSQCSDRMAIVKGDVLGMAGPGKKIAAIMPCTVIRDGDLADQLLDRTANPQWQGERTKAVYSWPVDEKLWERYRKMRADGLRSAGDTSAATEFYRVNRDVMDLGSAVAWPARKHDDELSAIQHMMNLRADLGEEAFAAEYQNEPIREESEAIAVLTPGEIAAKLTGVPRGAPPTGAEHLTAFVDVHDSLLFWCVAGWSGDFSGWVVDYGTFPKQPKRHFVMRKANPDLSGVAGGAGREGAILAGLTGMVEPLLDRAWVREDGTTMRITRCLVDAGYVPDTVYAFCRRSKHAAILMPSRGMGVTARSRPMTEYQQKPGERFGWNWLVTRTTHRRVQYVRFDSNHWKSFVHSRLAVALGDTGSLSLYGRDAGHHRLFAEHLTAEAPKRESSNGRTVDEWAMRPGLSENHWLDCLVGCAVGASMVGSAIPDIGAHATRRVKRKRSSLAEKMGRA